MTTQRMTRDRLLQIRLTGEEYDQLERQSLDEDRSISSVVRRRLFKETIMQATEGAALIPETRKKVNDVPGPSGTLTSTPDLAEESFFQKRDRKIAEEAQKRIEERNETELG